MTLKKLWPLPVLLFAGLFFAVAPARAQLLDFLFGKKAADAQTASPDSKRRTWRVGDFTEIQLVSRETVGADNQHPVLWPPEALRQQLASVNAELGGEVRTLFAADELTSLVGPLSQAFALAKPGDDVLLLSTHRRGGGILVAPSAVTARLFVEDGNLQLIVHDTRLDFYNTYRGSHVLPTFTYGSRVKGGNAILRSNSGVSRRADWLSIPGAAGAAVSTNVAPPAAVVAPVAPAAAPAPSVGVKPASAGPTTRPGGAPAPKPRDPGFAEEIEQRLVTLKRLRDKGLISEEEYQQKRKDVLQLL